MLINKFHDKLLIKLKVPLSLNCENFFFSMSVFLFCMFTLHIFFIWTSNFGWGWMFLFFQSFSALSVLIIFDILIILIHAIRRKFYEFGPIITRFKNMWRSTRFRVQMYGVQNKDHGKWSEPYQKRIRSLI